MTTRQEGHGGSYVKLGSSLGTAKGMITVNQLHSQYGESIGENMSPRSVLEHRALSGLAIAIDLEEKMSKSSYAEHHVVFGRYCCKQNTYLMGAGQEANSQQNLSLGSFISRERVTHMIDKERIIASAAPIVGLRMVASLYPLLHLNHPEAKKRYEHLLMGRSLSRERILVESMRYDEPQRYSHVLSGERKQGDVCKRGLKVSMSSSPPLKNSENRQPITCNDNQEREDCPSHERFLGERSTVESIFYYVNPSSGTLPTEVDDDELFCSPMENFLKICALCKCLLGVGKDIYMYRGDQAFCSAECRDRQIMIDECMDL